MYKLVLVLFLIPGAAAQAGYELSLEVEQDSSLLPPLFDRTMTVSWTVTCAGPAPIPNLSLEGGGMLEIDIAPPANVTVTGASSHVVALPDCVQSTTMSDDANFLITATPAAPAFVANAVPIGATLSWPQLQQTQTAEDDSQYDLFVEYYSSMEARVPYTMQEGAPGTVTPYEVQIVNFANAPTQYRFEFSNDAMNGSAVWPPEPLAPGAQGVAVVNFNHGTGSGWVNREDSVVITITPFAAENSEKEGPQTVVNVLARTRGGAVDTPGLGLPLVLAIVAGGALVHRRK